MYRSTPSLRQTVKGITLIDKAYRWAVPVLGLWLATWILLSSAGVQDDAFIHLRYADNLLRTHLITYDGVHPNYGAYSLLYVYLLAFLRAFTAHRTFRASFQLRTPPACSRSSGPLLQIDPSRLVSGSAPRIGRGPPIRAIPSRLLPPASSET